MVFRILAIILCLTAACGQHENVENANEINSSSSHPNASYFYVYDTTTKIYQYRDIVHGMNEQFHRIYGVEDSEGKHIVVERYSQAGRITEAYNYNLDSLNVLDHMVVNGFGEKEKATIYKNELFPFEKNKVTRYASKFSGFQDSTVILMELYRDVKGTDVKNVISDPIECIKLEEQARYTILNPFTKKETQQEFQSIYFFGKGVGLVEWFDKEKKMHFVLEDIISQAKWIKLISE